MSIAGSPDHVRRGDIDALRTVAVLLVILYHADVPGFGAGFIGVDIFFVISGYLMARILVLSDRPPGVLRFWMRRIRRVVPLLAVVIAVSAPVGWLVLMPGPLRDHGQAMVAALGQGSNLLFWWEEGYFELGGAQKPLLHTWSLGVEAQFYLVLPLILMLAGRHVFALLALLAGASYIAALALGPGAPEAVFYLLPFRLWELLAGSLAAIVAVRARGWFAFAGLALIAVSLGVVGHDAAWPGGLTLLPVAGTVLLLWRGFPALAPLVALGRWSYGLYLWHWPVFVFWGLAFPETPLAGELVWMLPALIAVSWATYRLVELPFQTGRMPVRPLPVLAGAAALGLAGVALHLSAGAPVRLNPAAAAIHAHSAREPMPCHNAVEAEAVAEGETCLLGVPGAPVRVALVGDSHAGHLAGALDARLKVEGSSGLAFTRSWCAPLPGLSTTAPGRGRDCGGFMEAVFDALEADPPDLLILAAQWGSYAQGGREGVPEVTYRMAGGGGFDAAVEALAGRLERLGTAVIVVGPTPEFGAAVPDSLMRESQRAGALVRALPPLDPARRHVEVSPALARLAGGKVSVIEPWGLFCKAGLCMVATEIGQPYFRDSNHLTDRGAARVVEKILPRIASAGLLSADIPR